MGFFRDFARSLRPGRDDQLAQELSTARRKGHRRSIARAAAEGQAWEDSDRQRDRRGGERHHDWT
jgi:hypothetical protein